MSEDSVLYARCRGLSDPYIVVRYAMPQAIISTVPTFMQMMGMCMAGSAIVETFFSARIGVSDCKQPDKS